MLKLARKIGEAICLLDKDGKRIATMRIVPSNRRAQISIAVENEEGYRVLREEVGLSRLENVELKFKVLMYKHRLPGFCEMEMSEAAKILIANSNTDGKLISQVLELAAEYEEVQRECNPD